MVKSAAFNPLWLAERLAALLPGFPDVPLCVALSGGVDSVTLLAALKAVAGNAGQSGRRPQRRPAATGRRSDGLRAIHVHHGLHPDADQWTRHCRDLAARLRVPLTVEHVRVDRSRGVSLEAAARDARYEAFAKALKSGEVLLTAHHQDDQLETVLLQLLRGAGIAGLAAMPELTAFARGLLARPLLTRSRAELERWAREHDLQWLDDPSNANERLDRNYLRRSVLPLVRARWPGAAAAVSRSARHAAEAKRLLDALALADVERASVGRALCVQRLRALDLDRRRNALRYWITRSGFLTPDSRRLDELVGPVLDARPDANPHVRWNDSIVERHADILSIRGVPSRSRSRAAAKLAQQAHAEATWNWHASPRLALAALPGALIIERDPHGPLDLDALPQSLRVGRRRGGETLRPYPGARARKLKALMQEARIPPDERDRLPLIYANDRLIAVADRWLDASVRATSGSARRGRLRVVRRTLT